MFPWKELTIIKQDKLEWNDNFFCLTDGSGSGSAEPVVNELEQEINGLKKRIEELFPNSYDWDVWKKLGNPYEMVFTPSKDKYPLPSMAVQNPLSRSYFKLWEIINVCNLQFPERIRTAHCCEGPGGFIQSIYDWTEKKNIKVLSTHAMTLRPDNPSIPGWRRATNFLKKHRTISIEYGPTTTGNILDLSNQEYFIGKAKGAHIFTADGGFDFSDEYDKQELNMNKLIRNSILIGTQVLAPGGHMVLKIFDTHYQITKDILFLLSSMFKRWTIYKPATSRPCNSERYFVGIDYRGVQSENKKIAALSMIEDSTTSLYRTGECVQHTEFMKILEEQNRSILLRQKQAIEAVLDAYQKNTIEEHYKEAMKLKGPSEDWCKKFSVPFIQGGIMKSE